jgi:hypothetical protein
MEDRNMEAIKVLEDVLTKKGKPISNEGRKRAVEALQALFKKSNDPKQVAGYLIKLHYSVCQAFLEELCSSASDDNIINIAETLVNDEQFKNGNLNNIMYPKGLSAVLALASRRKYQASFLILLRILAKSEKPGGFSDGCLNSFKKLIADKDGLPFISALFEQVTNGSVVCEEFERIQFTRFLKVIENNMLVTSGDAYVAVQNSDSTKRPAPKAGQYGSAGSVPQLIQVAKSECEETVCKIEKTQQDILAAMRKLADNRSSIDALTSAISRRDDELNSLRAVVPEKERRAALLASEVSARDNQISEMKRQIDDLTGRLRASLQMDDISKNQELITLKNDISEALKLDYADFVKSKDSPYDIDLFDMYRSTLTRIFKLLKRFGITCQ